MNASQPEKNLENVCDLSYLNEMMGGKKPLIIEIIDTFLKQVPEELSAIHNAIMKTDFSVIKNYAHTMKSSVSIMGITILRPILQEMEDLGKEATNLDRIKELNKSLTKICEQAMNEIERKKIHII